MLWPATRSMRLLAQRPEFRATHQWLTQYVAASTATARNTPTLSIPAPPK